VPSDDATVRGLSGSTPELLIEAGERLFAERGMHGVSLREIGLAAGQRNNGVTQYHFGSKAGLVLAIFERRSAIVNERRLQLLEEAVEAGRTGVHDLMEAFLVPLAEQVERGSHYVMFLARMRTEGNNYILRSVPNRDVVSAYDRIGTLLREGPLRNLPTQLFWNRWVLAIDLGIGALAQFQSAVPSAPPDLRLGLPEFVSELVDGLAGFLAAPSSLNAPAEAAGTTGNSATEGDSPRVVGR
jgi:AcrR family transcriptional regulator